MPFGVLVSGSMQGEINNIFILFYYVYDKIYRS